VTVLHAEQATRDGVLAALDHLVTTTTPDSTVLIYYAGHGHYDAPESSTVRAYFLTTHETDLTPEPPTASATLTPERWIVPETAISQAELLTALKQLPAQRVLLLFNACHAGELHPTMSLGAAPASVLPGSNPPEPLAAALLGTGSGRVIITACRDTQLAHTGGGPTTIFAEYLLAALQGQDVPNRTGTISVFDLYLAVYEKVKARVLDRLFKHQEPVLTMLSGVGPFPVALYQGATSMGIVDTTEVPPAGDAVRLISIQTSQQALATPLGRMDQKLNQIDRRLDRLTRPAPPPPDPRAQAQALLDAMPLDSIPDPAPIPPFSRMSYSPNPHFVGRNDALLALAQALRGGRRVALGPRAATTGLGGIGKTSVAAEFVHRYGQYFAGGVFWLSFADPAAVAGEVAACGGLGLLNLSPDFSGLKQDEQIALVTAAWRQEVPRLLVFDNCEDPKLVEVWAPSTGGSRVLLTSRRQRWPSGLQVQTHRLAVLARQSSIALLQQLAPRLTTAEAGALATELGDLPLALQLAGSYLAQYERTKVATYLAELTNDVILKHPSLQGKHDADLSLTDHERHVGRTFLVSYQHLDSKNATDALALQVLARAACLAPGEPIPLDLLLATAGLDAEAPEGQAASQRLIDLGFLANEADDTVQLHRLIHAFVQAVVQDATALAVVEQIVADRAKTINTAGYPSAMQDLLGHLRWMSRLTFTRTDTLIAAVGTELAEHLYYMGEYSTARPLYERALAIREQVLGSNHLDIALSLSKLSGLLQVTREYTQAQPLFERAIGIYEQVLGPDHPDTVNSLNNLASLLQSMEDYEGARPLYDRVVAIYEQALGPDHPDTVSSLNNLAVLLMAMGEYVAARPLMVRALIIYEQALGPDHPDTSRLRDNLAMLLMAMGEYVAARPLMERALAICAQALGPNHPDTASSLNNLAVLLYAMKDYSEARPLMEQVLVVREQVLGPDHPDTARSLNNLALLLRATEDYTGARPLYERALAIYEQALGPDHPDTARSLNNLAGLLRATGDAAGARPLLERALAIYEQALGPDHPDTATIRDNLAALDAAQGAPGADQEHPTDGAPDHGTPLQA
jgi:tetratricopeptide (TPR) repeat protein